MDKKKRNYHAINKLTTAFKQFFKHFNYFALANQQKSKVNYKQN